MVVGVGVLPKGMAVSPDCNIAITVTHHLHCYSWVTRYGIIGTGSSGIWEQETLMGITLNPFCSLDGKVKR